MIQTKQRGSALFIALIVITLLLLLGASTLSGSMVELRLSGVTKRNMDGFQKSEAGVNAIMSLVRTPDEPFNGIDNTDPFNNIVASNQPLREIKGGTVTAQVNLIQELSACTRKNEGSSNNIIGCEYYEIESTHSESNTGIDTTVILGVRKEVKAN